MVKLESKVEGCISCQACANECPESALKIEDGVATIRSDYCNGSACLRCELVCPEKVFLYEKMFYIEGEDAKSL